MVVMMSFLFVLSCIIMLF